MVHFLAIPLRNGSIRGDVQTHFPEGSVRKAGNQVRITAQLIDVRSDTHLWSETYDRELANIFAVQDEISAAIVCTDNPYEAIWQPAEGTCERFAAAGGD